MSIEMHEEGRPSRWASRMYGFNSSDQEQGSGKPGIQGSDFTWGRGKYCMGNKMWVLWILLMCGEKYSVSYAGRGNTDAHSTVLTVLSIHISMQ